MAEYPEHDKLLEVADTTQAIGEFLDFGDWHLMRWQDTDELPITGGFWREVVIEDALAEFFGIDRNKLELEKRAMLETIRTAPKSCPHDVETLRAGQLADDEIEIHVVMQAEGRCPSCSNDPEVSNDYVRRVTATRNV